LGSVVSPGTGGGGGSLGTKVATNYVGDVKKGLVWEGGGGGAKNFLGRGLRN